MLNAIYMLWLRPLSTKIFDVKELDGFTFTFATGFSTVISRRRNVLFLCKRKYCLHRIENVCDKNDLLLVLKSVLKLAMVSFN